MGAFAHPGPILALGLVLVPPLAVFAGKSTVPTLIAVALLALPLAWRHGWRPMRPSFPALAIAGAAAGWIGAASLWSPDPGESLSTGVRVMSLIVIAWLLADVAAHVATWSGPGRRGLSRCAVAGLAVAAAALLIEMLFDMPIKNAVTGLWGDSPAQPSEANRGGTFLLVGMWLLLPLTAIASGRPRLLACCLFVLTAAAIAVSESGTNLLALLTGLAFFGLAWLGRGVRLTLWASACAVGLIAIPWLAQALFDADLHELELLVNSARHRIFIWNYVGEWALEQPWTGWGFDTSAGFSNRGVAPWPGFSSVIPLHPHNAALQIWLELGVVGVVLAGALLARVVAATESAGAAWAPWLGAAAMSALVAASSGYGIWQTQWIAALAWLACYGRLAVALAPSPASSAPSSADSTAVTGRSARSSP